MLVIFCFHVFEVLFFIFFLCGFIIAISGLSLSSPIVLVGYADCFVARFNEKFSRTFRIVLYLFFFIEMVSYRLHRLVNRNK